MIETQIPWHIIGPAAAAAIVILVVVFTFIIKMRKLENRTTELPKDVNTVSKKSLCLKHEGEIAENRTAIKMLNDTLKTNAENNRQDHAKLFDKIDEVKLAVIKEIKQNNKKRK